MLRPAVNQIITKNESCYSLVIAVAKRAREISLGSEQLVVCDSDKEVTIAANELYQGKIRITENKDASEEEAGEENA